MPLIRLDVERFSALDLLQGTAYSVGVPLLAAGYSATVALLGADSRWRRRLAGFGPLGRMALTGYLSQSVIGVLLVYGYGLGWFGRVGPTLSTALGAGILPLQIRFSGWWLARFRFGPMEWLWRQWTYRRRLPIRVALPDVRSA